MVTVVEFHTGHNEIQYSAQILTALNHRVFEISKNPYLIVLNFICTHVKFHNRHLVTVYVCILQNSYFQELLVDDISYFTYQKVLAARIRASPSGVENYGNIEERENFGKTGNLK